MTPEQLVAMTDGLTSELVPMPTNGPDVCPYCRTCKADQWPACYSCGKVRPAVEHPCPDVIPISFYRKPADDEPPSVLRDVLHDYKEHDDISVRDAAANIVAAILARYYREHAEELANRFGQWTDIVAVPSTKHDNPSGLVTALAESFTDFMPAPVPLLAPGPGHKGRNAPDPTAFAVAEPIEGRRLLLIDDTFTTGSALHSAAECLAAAGATVIAGLVIARKINPDPKWDNSVEVWDRQVAHGFSFTEPPWWAIGE